MSKYLADTHEVGHDRDHAYDSGGNAVFDFWSYLMTDRVPPTSAFVTYAALVHHTTDGPSGKNVFKLPYVLAETTILLVSSYAYGLAMFSVHKSAKGQAIVWLRVTFLLGVVSIGVEISEFHYLIAGGFGPSRSASLSSLFTLVGMHGLHVSAGLLQISVLMAQIRTRGLAAQDNTRMMCLSLFQHFLDIAWTRVFTVVHLMGALQ